MKVGIIGCGKVSSAGHIPAFRKLGLDIIGIADSNKTALKRIPLTRRYTDYKELLKQDLDIVSICTPPFLHYEMCLEAAERGINILVEKPLALSIKEGEAMKKAAERNNVKLSVMHNYKFLDPFIKAKRMQETGQLGRLLSIHTLVHGSSPPARENWKLDEKKSGSMILQWNHPLYLHTWFAGNPKSVYAIGKKIIPDYPSIADMQILIEFEDCTGFIEMSQFSACPRFSFGITGTGASLALQPTTFKVLAPSTSIEVIDEFLTSISNIGKTLRVFVEMRQKPHMRYTWGSHFKLIKQFVESVKEDVEVPINVDEGIMSIKLAQAIAESIQSGAKVTL